MEAWWAPGRNPCAAMCLLTQSGFFDGVVHQGQFGPGDFSYLHRCCDPARPSPMQRHALCSRVCAVLGPGKFLAATGLRSSISRPSATGDARSRGNRELPYIDGLTPAFTRHLIYWWALGDMPLSGNGGGEIGGWFRFRKRRTAFPKNGWWPWPMLAHTVLSMLTTPAV